MGPNEGSSSSKSRAIKVLFLQVNLQIILCLNIVDLDSNPKSSQQHMHMALTRQTLRHTDQRSEMEEGFILSQQ